MALDRSIYKRLPDLYKTGKTVTLPDGQPMWLQVLNPFERDEAVRDASVARTRLKLSIENHPESDEAVTLELVVSDMTREDMIDEMVTGKKVNAFLEVYDEMRAEDEWREKVNQLLTLVEAYRSMALSEEPSDDDDGSDEDY